MPVLVLSGANDPATPPRFGEAVTAHLPNGRHVVVPNAGHTPANPCLSRVVADFFAHASARDLDVSCIEQYRRPPFTLP